MRSRTSRHAARKQSSKRDTTKAALVVLTALAFFAASTSASYALWSSAEDYNIDVAFESSPFAVTVAGEGIVSDPAYTPIRFGNDMVNRNALKQATGHDFEQRGNFAYPIDLTTKNATAGVVHYNVGVMTEAQYNSKANPWHEHGSFAIKPGKCGQAPDAAEFHKLVEGKLMFTTDFKGSSSYCLYGQLDDDARAVVDKNGNVVDTNTASIDNYVDDSKAVYKNTATVEGTSVETGDKVNAKDYWMTWVKRFYDPGPGSVSVVTKPAWVEGICLHDSK